MFEFFGKMWEWVQAPIGFTTVIGGGFAAWQFWKNCRSSRLNNELTSAPRFCFTKPGGCDIFNNSKCSGGDFTPELTVGCGGEKRVCWFGLANMGRFAARDVKIAIAKQDELNNVLDIPHSRWKTMDYWGGNMTGIVGNAEIARLTTALGELELTAKDQNLYVLLEYKSDYSNIRYKYFYQWCISDDSDMPFKESKTSVISWKEMEKMREEYDSETGLSEESMCRLSRMALGISEPLFDIFEEMKLSRPVFLREVRTVKAVSSNKAYWWTKAWTRLRCKVSRKVTKDDWLKHF